MALSVVNFRMHHGTAMEQITFSGNGIKLLDLKKEILDKKEISRSLDFDLKIVDENGKVYAEDDEVVPKNASIVVRRVPSKNSLVSRLNNRSMAYGHGHAAAIAQPKGEILMPMKAEVEDAPPAPVAPLAAAPPVPPPAAPAAPAVSAPAAPAPVPPAAPAADDGDVLRLLADEETALKRTIPVSAPWSGLGGANGGAQGGPMGGMSGMPMDSRYGNRGGRGPGAFGNKPHPAGAGAYTCNRCQKTGHYAKFCPTLGDPSFDPEIRLMNVPRTGRKVVNTLEGIDTTMSTVIERTDGSYEVFESSARGLEKLTKEGGSHAIAHIDMEAVPVHLKCALSNTLLREAVTLPCCSRNVNDSVIRLRLVSSGLTCPLCNTPGVSPDSLIIRKDLRDQVDHYLDGLRKAEESPAVTALSMASPAFPGFAPPPPAGPPPPQHMLPPAMHGGVVPPMGGAYPGMMGGMMMPGQGMYPGMPGMGFGMGMGMGMALPPGWDEVPPVEALPLPLSREQFLYEQKLQIILLKEMNGGVLPRSVPAPMGFQQGPGAGRGFGRGTGGFGGRGFRGGGGYDRDFIPGGRGAPGYQGGYPEQPQQQGYVPKERDYPRYDEGRRRDGIQEENVAKRRRDESGYDSRGDRDPRRRSSSRTRPDEGKRPADRPPARQDERLGERMDRDRERGAKRERSPERKRDDSRARASSRDRAKKPAHEESSNRASASDGRREVAEEHDSKRRRHEGESRGDRDREAGREKEREPRERDRERRDRDHEKDRERSKRDDKDRPTSHKSSSRRSKSASKARAATDADVDASRGARERKPDREEVQEDTRRREDGGRASGGGERHHRGERDRDHDRAREKDPKEKERESRDKRRSSSRDRGGDRAKDGAKDSGRDKERGAEDNRGKSGSSRSKPSQEPEIVFQDRGRDHRDREKGSSKSVLVSSNKAVNIPPLKSSRAPDSHAKGQRIVKL